MAEPNGIIGICGSGLIGKAWAMLFASAGYQVNVFDLQRKQVDTAIAEIRSNLEGLEKKSLLRGSLSVEQQINLIIGVTSLEDCVKGAQHIQECIPERVELKKELFEKLDEIAEPGAILASSTSSIVCSAFTENLKNRENCLVNHPINPPYTVRLIEIVPSPWTSKSTIEKTRKFMEKIGQAPVVFSREIPGFGLNRIQMAIMNECWHLVADGILNAADVDTLMTEGLAPRYVWQGPLETAHLLANGIENAIKHFGPSFVAMNTTYKPHPSWSVEDSVHIIEQMNEAVPLDKLQERRKWRDDRLVAFAKLRSDLNKDSKEN